MSFMRLFIATLVLIAVNLAVLLPPLAQYQMYTPIISVLLGFYLLAHLLLARQSDPAAAPKSAATASAAEPGRDRDTAGDAAVIHFLSILQDKGRLVDFLMEDIASHANDQVGAAARVVHQGCRGVLREYFSIVPAHEGREGEPITLEPGYRAEDFRLVGKPGEAPPHRGTLLHCGWRASEVRLPRRIREADAERSLIAPAEVEIKG